MGFSVKIEKEAHKALSKISAPDRVRLVHAIDKLETAPESGKPLQGHLRLLRSLRVGDYRVIYNVRHQELFVLIVRIGHRREVYR